MASDRPQKSTVRPAVTIHLMSSHLPVRLRETNGPRLALRMVACASTLALASCAMLKPVDTSLALPQPLTKPARAAGEQRESDGGMATDTGLPQTQFLQTPPLPPRGASATGAPPAPAAATGSTDMLESAVTLENMPIPVFANAVFGNILKRNVSIDAAVQSRTDLVSLKTGKPVSGAQLAAAAQAVLRSYGVVATDYDGLVRVVPESSPNSGAVSFRRGRAQPDVPSALRPVFFLAEIENTNAGNISNWIRTFFQGRVTVTDDQARNAVLLSGQSDSVSAAAEAIQLLDQPALRGQLSARINPAFWSAPELAGRLVEVLTAQGYYAAQSANQTAPILVIPIPAVNSVIVFAANTETLNHVLRWARELDQAPPNKGGKYVTYYVRNTDASEVARTLQDVLGGGSGAAATVSATPGAPAAAAARVSTPGTLPGGGRVVVNAAANSIIIQSTPAEYQQIYSLLQELDRPPRSALIMATVAEVRLSDTEQFGFSWLLKQFTSGGYNVNTRVGPTPVAGTTGAGLALSIASVAGDPRALLTALASSNRVRVLSNPSIVALSGYEATIQVGEDVPVLTSQISNANTGGTNGSQGVLQTVQYRSVGIILRVRPVVHAGGRVDLEMNQEVSGVSSNNSGLGNSPVVTTRRIQTRLSAQDGNTMLLGGLIREQRDGGNAGVPFFKDIPVAGSLFRTSANDNFERTELVVLLTPYVIEDDFDSRAVTNAFRSQFGWAKGGGLGVMAPEKVGSGSPGVSPVPGAGGAGDSSASGRGAGGASPAAMPSKAKPYVVPDEPALKLKPSMQPYEAQPSSSPAGSPLPAGGAAAPGSQSGGSSSSPAPAAAKAVPGPAAKAAGGASAGSGTTPAVPKGTQPVGDEKLRRELLDAAQGAK